MAYAYHQYHCGGHCSFKCTVRDGRVALLEPNDGWEDRAFATCCIKGLSEVQHIYSRERIQSPMKRVGERGEGKFEAISWDEAFALLKENLEAVWEAYGRDAVYVHTSGEAGKTLPFLAPMLGAQTGGRGGIDMGVGNGIDQSLGSSVGTTDLPGEDSIVGIGFNCLSSDPRDLVNSKFILNIGNNNLETSLTQSAFFLDAQEAGARIVSIDPCFTTTASKADEWIPIRPGTDAALYLGMISVVLDRGLQNEAFMKERTGLCFLVDRDTGLLLTGGAPVVIDDKGKETHPGDYLIWDAASNKASLHDAPDVEAALTGDYTVGESECCTVFDLLVENQEPYSAEWASEVTGIPAEKIEELAIAYATSGASAICTGFGGNDKMSNADIAGHALAILVGITGNIGRPGACVGNYAEGSHWYEASFAAWQLPENMAAAAATVPAYNLRYEENKVRAYIACGDAVHQRIANLAETERWLKSLDFICAIDMCFATFTDYADLVLPVTSKFESEEPYSGLKSRAGHILLREKVIEPLFDSKSDFQLQVDIAELFGVRDALPASCEEWFRYQLDNSSDETISHITFDTLVEHHGVQEQSCHREVRRAYVDRFGTPSSKMELYYENMIPFGQAMPSWEPCIEVYEGNPLQEEYPLQLLQAKSRFRIHNQYYDAQWINDICGGVYVEMNPVDMASRELNDGDMVRMRNQRGHTECAVRANEAVRPGIVRTCSSVWNKFMKSGGIQYLTNDALLERQDALMQGPNIPFNDTLIEVERA